MIQAAIGLVSTEIKPNHKNNRRMLAPLKTVIKDTIVLFCILVNNSEKVELLADNIIHIPAGCF